MTAPARPRLQRGGVTSAYLDVLRVGSVLLVLLSHTRRADFTQGFLDPFGQFGQEGVAIFFVLSGLVVADSTLGRRRSFREYAVARLSRLWSVALPAIVVTIVLDVAGRRLAPDLYRTVPEWGLDAISALRAGVAALFLNGVPPFVLDIGSNGPFWSLSYEAWYYLAFAAAVFLGGWGRALALAAIALLAGAPIRALAPIWLLGVALRFGLGGPSRRWAWAGWVGTIAAALAVMAFKYRLIALVLAAFPHGVFPGLADEAVVEKYAIGLLVAANILCFDRISAAFASAAERIRPGLGFLVDRSFSLYLYQAPLLFFIAAASHGIASRPVRIAILFAGVLVLGLGLAEITELRRGPFLRWLARRPAQAAR